MTNNQNTKGTDLPDLTEQAENRSKVYMLLSTFYMERPEQMFVKKILHEDFIMSLKTALQNEKSEIENGTQDIVDFIDANMHSPLHDIVELLAVDYTRLFRGIQKDYGPPPPYESVWRGEDRIMGTATRDVLRFYHESGIGMDLKDEVPDYIGIELKFMSLLCYREKDSWEKEDVQTAMSFIEYEQDFFQSFLSEWVPAYCDRMVEEARTGFYRGVGKITRDFIGLDRDILRETLIHVKEFLG